MGADAARLRSLFGRLHARDARPLPVVVAWDVEPDDRLVDRRTPGPWTAFEATLPRVEPLRNRLESLTGAPVSFSWLLRMDPQIEDTWGSPSWAADRYASVFAELTARGDEVGLHTHMWRWEAAAGVWTRDHDPAWEEHCADTALDAFEAAFGRPCRTHRVGDRVLSQAILGRLEERNVAVDLTVEPDKPPLARMTRKELATALTPDYRVAPRTPYRTSPAFFPAADPAGGSGPLIMPMACAPRGRRRERKALHLLVIPGVFELRLLRAVRSGVPVLAFALRTDQRTVRAWDILERNLDHLASTPGARFVTGSSAAARFAPASAESPRVAPTAAT